MKLFVSSKQTQGQRADDFCYVPEGELLKFPEECTDVNCGCARSMVGVKCNKATTTLRVAEVLVSFEQLVAMLQESEVCAGYKARPRAEFRTDALDLIDTASRFPLGAVVEKFAWRPGLTYSAQSFRVREAVHA